ncbi:DNA-dependent ATPase mgs1 [Coemansia sp. RSA 2131]|nr:DNA-dependent ATPase mgs1 [Coemansia sp. RSA 2131]
MSSLVNCPVCNKAVPEWFMSDHLDRECSGMLEGDSTGAASPATQAPPKRAAEMQSPVTQRKKPAFLFNSPKKTQLAPSALPEYDITQQQKGAAPSPLISMASRQSSNMDNADELEAEKRLQNTRLPLAERLRPVSLDQFVGQKKLVGPQGILRALIESDQIPSMIFWSSPGLGKTTLARIIARRSSCAFKELSAVTQNLADVKKVIDEAGNLIRLTGKRTILFLDEIHRFNKAQQDVFLPHLERGQVILIGATTENPSFRLNGALLSRCRVFQLDALSASEIAFIASHAYALKRKDAGQPAAELDPGITEYIASVSNGDARAAINIVDLAMNSLPADGALDLSCIRQALQRTHVVYGAEEHFDLISAFHKSIRGSDDNAALYWLGRMLQGGDDPVYIARRLVRASSEDIGLADSGALPLAMATLQACQAIGMPECDTILAHCTAYMARAPKSVESYMAFGKVKAVVSSEHPWPVPLHLRNAPTRLMKELGYAEGYKYNPDYEGPVDQEYLPEQIRHYNFFKS